MAPSPTVLDGVVYRWIQSVDVVGVEKAGGGGYLYFEDICIMQD